MNAERPAALRPPHGFEDDAATRQLLRSRPPAAALGWATRQLGATRILRLRALRGGLSSAMHLLAVDLGRGPTVEVVLRRYVRPELSIEEPDLAAREAVALTVADRLDVPTPRLIASDPTGQYAGVPALIMSRLPGRVDWTPTDMERWLGGLVDLLPAVHAATLPAPGTIRPYAPYGQGSYAPPGWARRPVVWERAVELFHGPALDRSGDAFIHRDFHPGNVLWQHRMVSGLVDWPSASLGPPSVDVGHCRANLLRYGVDVADRFAHGWERATGRTFHPWADIVALIGCLDELRDPPPTNRAAIERVVGRAVADLYR